METTRALIPRACGDDHFRSGRDQHDIRRAVGVRQDIAALRRQRRAFHAAIMLWQVLPRQQQFARSIDTRHPAAVSNMSQGRQTSMPGISRRDFDGYSRVSISAR